MEVFRRVLPADRNELKQRLFKMVAEKEIDLGRAHQGANNRGEDWKPRRRTSSYSK